MNFNDDTIYILDSYGLIYRSYFAFINHPLTNSKGENISAIFGFFRNLANVFQTYNPKHMIAALDSKTPTFRHQMYEAYKGTREKSPDDLIAQIQPIEDILSAMGIPCLRVDGYEADDVIATIAKECCRTGKTCRILSGDKDLMQLVCDSVQIMKPSHDTSFPWKIVGVEGVKEEWGVYPEGLLDLLSLTGDAADNVPGVKGVGVKTGVKYLEQYGSLEGIYEHADEIKGAIGEKIRAGKEDAFFSQKLITLCETVPLEGDYTALPVFNFSAAKELLNKAECFNVAKSYGMMAGGADKNGTPKGSGVNGELPKGELPKGDSSQSLRMTESAAGMAGNAGGMAGNDGGMAGNAARMAESAVSEEEAFVPAVENLGNYKAVTSLSELHAFIDTVVEKKLVAYDSETTGLEISDKMVGFSLSVEKGSGIYVPVAGGDDLFSEGISLEEAKPELLRIFDNPEITCVMHNAKFDYKVLKSAIGMGRYKCRMADTLIAAWLLNSEHSSKNSYALGALGERVLHLKGVEFEDIVEKGKVFTDVPLDIAANYAAEDADFTLQLWNLFEEKLKTANLYDLFWNLEMPLLPVLAEMEYEGIYLDAAILDAYDEELTAKLETITKDIYDMVGHSFNIASTKQLGEVLFNELGLKCSKKTKTGYSTDNAVLEELLADHPVISKILEYRENAKLQSTYVEPMPKLCDETGAIHTNFLQFGTATGRLSCRDPNLQNIPVRSESGRKIRSAFTARPGHVLISADYSQIELVVLAHLSGDENMSRAFNEGTDIHKATASLIFGLPADKITPDMRRTAKTINFGVIYGMSAFRLAKDLGISRTQSKEFIETYFDRYSAIRDFITNTVHQAETTGEVKTMMGHRRKITGITSGNKIEKAAADRMAVNTPVQGTAADIVKQAMINLDKALTETNSPAKMLLQVHDELILECPDNEADIEKTVELLKKTMESAVKLNVPLKVSVETGKNWGLFH